MTAKKKTQQPGPGRPATEFTREHLDEARDAIGRKGYPSRCADALASKFGMSRPTAYKLLDAARSEVIAEMQARGQANDPLSAMATFFFSVTFDQDVPIRDRIAAANGLTKLLALDRVVKAMESGDVDGFIATIVARQVASGRIAVPTTEGNQ